MVDSSGERPLGASIVVKDGAGEQYVHIRADVDGADGDAVRGTLGYRAALEAEDMREGRHSSRRTATHLRRQAAGGLHHPA